MERKDNLIAILAVYLLGLLVGGLYVGMVSPVRMVVQEHFGLGDTTGIWMINIYTLFYAALIPVIGKIADIAGRKPVFVACLIAFSIGSFVCGISAFFDSFAVLLAGRVIQASGACGIIPVANAEIGVTFPKEKRGMALGLAAAVAGIANIFGAAVGSILLGALGNANWPQLFFVAIPICVALAIAGALVLPSHVTKSEGKLDVPGSFFFVAFVLSVLLGLQHLDFSNPANLLPEGSWQPLAAAAVCLAAFIAVERKASNPVFHFEYLHSRPIVVTMAVSFFVGCVIISMTLIPELAEFVTNAPTGSGGTYVIAVGVLAMMGPIVGGRLIDKVGPKPVMMSGLALAGAGYLFLAFVSLPAGNAALLIVGLMLMGAGMGFAMGAPTNYMILENTDPSESSSAIATITLVRQMGTTLAPAILLGFVEAAPGIAGFRSMLICVAVFCAVSLVCMVFYQQRK